MAQLGVVSSASKNIWTFDPRTVSGCCLWLDGADSKTLFSNSAGTTLASIGNNVLYWKDKSLTANNATLSSSFTLTLTGASGNGSTVTYTYNNTNTYAIGIYIGNTITVTGASPYNVTNAVITGFTTTTITISSSTTGTATLSSPTLTVNLTSSNGPTYLSGGGLGFNGSQYLSLTPASLPNGSSNRTYFVVANTSSSSKQTILSHGAYSGGNGIYIQYNQTANTGGFYVTNLLPYAYSNILTPSNYNIICGMINNYEVNAFANGTAFAVNNLDLEYNAYGYGLYNIGTAYACIGTDPSNTVALTGNILEILVYNRTVLTAERLQIEGYLAQKWGFSTGLPSTHPFKLSKPLSRGFVPTDVDTCILWLDAADSNTLSFTGSYVTGLYDKSGQGNNAFNSSSTLTYTNTINNLGVVTTGTSVSTPNISLNPYNATYFVVFRITVNYSTSCRPLNIFTSSGAIVTFIGTTGGSTTSSSAQFFMELNESAYIGGNDFITGIGTGNNTYLTNVPIVSCIQRAGSVFSASTNGGWISSNTTPINTPPLANSGGYYFTIGGGSNYDIAEVIIYNSAITQNERQKIEGYLIWKWGQQRSTNLSTAFTSSHPYYNFPPSSETLLQPTNIEYKTVFSPADLQPLVWLDAQDSSTYTTSSNRLTSWISKGVGASATATVTTVTPSSPSSGYVTYTLSNSASYGQPTSGFVVGQPVIITGISPSGYNVYGLPIYSTTGTTITIANSTTGTATLTSATAVTPLAFTPPSGISGPLVTTSGIGSGTGLTIMDFSNGGVFQITAGVVSTATTLTLTTKIAHGIPVGGVILLNLVNTTFAGGYSTSPILNGIYTTQSGTTGSTVVITIPPSPNGTMVIFYGYLEYGVLPIIRSSVSNSYGTFNAICATPHGLTASSSVIGINNDNYSYSDGAALSAAVFVNSRTNTYTVQTTPTSSTFTTTLSTTSSNIQSITQNTGISLGSISAIAFSSPNVTVTVSSTSGLYIGFSVTISGSTYNNGTFIVTSVPSGTTFTILNSAGAAETPASATATYSYTSCVLAPGSGFSASNYSMTISGATNTSNNGLFYIANANGTTMKYYNPNGVSQASPAGSALTGIANGNIGTTTIFAGYVASPGTTLYLYAPGYNLNYSIGRVAYLNITGTFNGGTTISLNGYYLIQSGTSGSVIVFTIPSSPTGVLTISNGYIDILSSQIVSASIPTTSTTVSALTASSPVSGYVTYTVSSVSGFVVGATVTITGITPSGYNVTGAKIVYVGSNTITVANSTTGGASFSSATATLTGNTLSITTGYGSTAVAHNVSTYDYLYINFGGSSKLSDGTTNANTLNGVYQLASAPSSSTMILVLSTTYVTGSLTSLSSSDIVQFRPDSYAMYPLNGYALESVSNTANPILSPSSLFTGIFVTHYPNLIITLPPSRASNLGSGAQSKILAGAYSAGGYGGGDTTSGGRDFSIQMANYAGPASRYGIKHNNTALQVTTYYNNGIQYASSTSTNTGFQITTFEFNMTGSAIGDVPANTQAIAVGGWRYSNFSSATSNIATNSSQTNTLLSISHLRIGADTIATSTYSSYPLNGYFYEGQIGDILFFSGTLTLDQRQLLEGWIADKYGCRALLGGASITSGNSFIHPYNLNTVAPLYNSVSDSNLYIQGLAAWFDAANSSTIGFSSGSLVNLWASAGGFVSGLALTQSNTSYQPTLTQNLLNGLPGIVYTITTSPSTYGNYLYSSTSYNFNQFATISSNTEFTIFIVANRTQSSSTTGFIFNISSGGNTHFGVNSNLFGYVYLGNNSTNQSTNFNVQLALNTPTILTTSRRGLTNISRTNGTDNGSTTNSSNLQLSGTVSNICAGAYSNADPYLGELFGGNLHEIIVFRYALTDQQIQYIEGYLGWKWGLQNTLGLIASPLNIPSCILWLDGNDYSTFSFSGSKVTQWNDKSGSSNHVYTNSGTPTYGSGVYLSQANNGVMQSSTYINVTANTTLFVVVGLRVKTSYAYIISFSDITGSDYSVRCVNAVLSGTPASSGNSNDFGNGNYYVNGSFNPNYGSGTYLTTAIIDAINSGGSTGSSRIQLSTKYISRNMTGTINEVILFSNKLTNYQHMQVEAYLGFKWGITLVNQPVSTHPYFKTRP